MSGVDQHAEAHRLKAEGYGARRIGQALGITRHAATLLLSQPLAEPVAETVAGVGQPVAAVAATDGQEQRPVAERPLPQRTAQPLEGIDLSRWPAVRRDLAVLAQTGLPSEVVAFRAITALAHHYSRALAAGDIDVGQPFVIREMALRPVPVAGRTVQGG